jgi:B12 binding domain/Radical SAM superfamily
VVRNAFPHPLGGSARVLLSSVFGPYARDDEHGSRAINPMELYHNQVTRLQGVFSLRMFHRSWGLMLIQANLDAPCTLLDFPSLERFVQELRERRYDVIGIGGILPNLRKVATMCALIREHQPRATIVVGGHVANHPRLRQRVDADHVVRGEGVAWFRRFLGEDASQPIRHPLIPSAIGARTLGVRLSAGPEHTAATLIPSVGCPLGCNFCSTSAMFGGKGHFVSFYQSGDELYDVMCGLEQAMGVQSFFVMDENFLLHRKRALRLLQLMRENAKAWALYVFSSANTLRLYRMDELVGLGISWVWLGLEGKQSAYTKLKGVDTLSLVRELQSHGIRVLGSSIVGLMEHTPENLDEALEHAVAHDTEFHQFMLYTPIPGTPLYAEHEAAGTLLDEQECPAADAHGQLRFNFRHPYLKDGQETAFLLRGFRRDFEVNGPSVVRIARTLLQGWRRHRHHPEARVRERFRRECADLATAYAGAAWAAERWLRGHAELAARIAALRRAMVEEFGLKARLAGPVLGRGLLLAMRRDDARLRRGHSYEPPTYYEANPAAARTAPRGEAPALCRWVEPPATREGQTSAA